MACLLKAPCDGAPGVVTFTTQERDNIIHPDPALRERIESLKARWVVGLHHNWHDWRFDYDPLYDFSMAGEEDLRERRGREFPLVPLDACNFTPPVFHPGGEKFWDILYVARAVFFKRVPEFLQAIRRLYDRGLDYRALLICPVPPYDPAQKKTVLYNVRDIYDEMFSPEEQDRFTLLTMDYRYPFPFDLPTLAHFYRSSKVFMHTADDERRCRVAAYAWASGLPVVAQAPPLSVLPPELRREPYCYEVNGSTPFDAQVERALEEWRPERDFGPVREVVSAEYTPERLELILFRLFGDRGLTDDHDLAAQDLDLRLGRHHGMGDGPNFVPQTVGDFVRYLAQRPDDLIRADLAQRSPEHHVAALPGFRSAHVGGEVVAPPPPTGARRLADAAYRAATRLRLTG